MKPVYRKGTEGSSAKSGKSSVGHATSVVSDFRAEGCLDRKKKKVNHEHKSLLLPLHCSPPPSAAECLGSLQAAHRLFLLGSL